MATMSVDASAERPQLTMRTRVVDGPLALRMHRRAAAEAGEAGLQIVTIAQLAARLAGGFARPAVKADLELAVQAALAEGGFSEIVPLAPLPGMVRAVVRTLDRLWRAGIAVAELRDRHARLADLALIEDRVRTSLGGGARLPADLVSTALARRSLFSRLAGPVVFSHVDNVAPVWRPLIEALAGEVPLAWEGCVPPPGWSAGDVVPGDGHGAPVVNVVSCAHPQAEAIEALRWARELIASGRARPNEVAIAAAAPEKWDDTLLGLANAAQLPIHFSHGIPALCTIEGQSCAALADLLTQGLSYGRIDRLLGHSGGRCPGLPALPPRPLGGVAAGAALGTIEQWRRALRRAAEARDDAFDIAAALDPLLLCIAEGIGAAGKAGDAYLPQGAARLWRAALQCGPASALPFTLASQRVSDSKDPAAHIVWGPASHIVGAPRPWVRLLGLTSRAWPRPQRDDPLLPGHILAADPALSPPRPEVDRRHFAAICRNTWQGLTLSYARRTAQGGAQAPSPLLPAGVAPCRLERLRIPEHAYSESDRLQARRKDGAETPRLARPIAAARSRRQADLTAWDGMVRADHPLIAATLAEVQSVSSLRRLLRDPQAFVWRHALGWQTALEDSQTLHLDDRAFGEIVHWLLQHMVTSIEAGPGFARAANHEIEMALALAKERVFLEWPTMRPAPPPMLWRHIVGKAGGFARAALRFDSVQPDMRNWMEVGFGGEPAVGPTPWDPTARVIVPGTDFAILGRIDRVEIAAVETAVHITDYKIGRAPPHAAALVLAGGAELQRALYAVAARSHLPDARIRADLVYLGQDPPARHEIAALDAAMTDVARLLNRGAALLRQGLSLPGPDAEEAWNPYRLARPPAGDLGLKKRAVAQALGDFRTVWNMR